MGQSCCTAAEPSSKKERSHAYGGKAKVEVKSKVLGLDATAVVVMERRGSLQPGLHVHDAVTGKEGVLLERKETVWVIELQSGAKTSVEPINIEASLPDDDLLDLHSLADATADEELSENLQSANSS